MNANEALLNNITTVWNRFVSGEISEDESVEQYRGLCEDFNARFGDGSAHAVITASRQSHVEPAEFTWCAGARRGLGPQLGELAGWLNREDVEFLKSLRISL
jgi:hypothetical protein